MCGQQSLYIFCLGILLSVLGHFFLAEFAGGFLAQVAVNLVGIGAMIGVAAMLEWYRVASRGARPAHTSSIPATPSE